MKDTLTYKNLKQAKFTDILFDYLGSGIFWAICFAVLSIVGFFLIYPSGDKPSGHFLILFEAMWVFTGLQSAATYTRISRILFKLLRQD